MQTIDEANEIIKLAKEKNVKIQVGHIERFNPALTSLRQFKINPLFIESHRISPFNPRGIDVAVILDLMIHDIDIILSLVDSTISQIDAAGAPVLTDNIDIANARIKFDNGCVANITASRVSNKKMRKLRIFQSESYFSIDFLKNSTEVYILSDSNGKLPGIPLAEIEAGKEHKKTIFYQQLKTKKTNALREELLGFIESIRSDTKPAVTGEDGKRALEVAIQIESQIKSELKKTFSGYKKVTF
jgi:predicted dehydrogenase